MGRASRLKAERNGALQPGEPGARGGGATDPNLLRLSEAAARRVDELAALDGCESRAELVRRALAAYGELLRATASGGLVEVALPDGTRYVMRHRPTK
jgi:hypothetical protein